MAARSAAQTLGATTTVRSSGEDGDRLYVRGADGRRIGWYDLRTGTTQVVDPDPGAAAEVQAAVDAYAAAISPLRRRRAVDGLATTVPAPRTSPDGQGGNGPDRAGGGRAVDPDLFPEDLRERGPGEHATHLLLDRAVARALDPAGRGRFPSLRDPLGPTLRQAHQTALGQRQVGAALAGLGARWHVLHDVPTADRGWLDHLLVGPGGVVVLRTATHPGAVVRVVGDVVRAGSRPSSDVRLVRRQVDAVAARLRAGVLPVAVRGVVVVVGARAVRARDLPAGVSVVRLVDLPRWVADLPTVLSQVDVSRLGETAARGSTWPAEADAPARRSERQARREHDQAALGRLTARARHVARLRKALGAGVLGCATAAALAVGQVLSPGFVTDTFGAMASAIVGMIGG